MNKLIITEKPSVAQAIAAVVGALERKDGYFEGGGYLVGWCLGHLAQLVSAEAYDPQLSRWRVADLPILPQDWRYRVPQDKRRQFGILRGLMLRDDVSQVINACDAGREGELIFRNLYELTGCSKPILRLWLNSMEEAEIRRALGDLRPGADYDRLFAAARCRERADWLVGINATRLLSVTYHRTLNTGRVVSPTLALLTQREAGIAGFVPEAFYTAQLHLGEFSAESKRFSNRAEAEEAVVSAGGKCVVTAVSTKEKSENAPVLYDLTMLQREANRVLGYTAQQTLDYLQSLYEKRLCTYPRTDSRYLTDGMEEGVKSLVLCASGICGLEPPFAVYAEQVCDSAKVSDHHALVPTMSSADCELEDLPAGECELLRLMAAQVLRAVCAPHRWLETSVELVLPMVQDTQPVHVGSFRGFDVEVSLEAFGKHVLTLKGALEYHVELGEDARGNISRIENALTALDKKLGGLNTRLSDLERQVENARKELEKPFPQEDELRKKSARLVELNAELDMENNAEPQEAEKPSVLAKLKEPIPLYEPKPHQAKEACR